MNPNYRHIPQLSLSIDEEIFVDNFAGGGGASTGVEQAIGRPIDIAINHSAKAIEMHKINHPATVHYNESVWHVCPKKVCQGRRVAGAWFSPDCTHYSKARGKKPKCKKIRGLAWVAVRWIHRLKPTNQHPRIIYIENVEEFTTWGPLDKAGKPIKERAGETFRHFVSVLESYGYVVEHKILKAHEYGAPTTRKRLFMIARCDGQPIIWPQPTHGKGLKKVKTAADCIDWSIQGQSIFTRQRPLAENTLRRIALGLEKFVFTAGKPFIVPIQNYGQGPIAHSIDEPIRTITAYPKGGAFALVTSHLVKFRGTGKNLAIGQEIEKPLPTITAGGIHFGEVRAFLVKYYGSAIGQPLDRPLDTITAKHRFGLVTIHGENYQIVDITFRMLTPRELFNAQGFPADYVIDRYADGSKVTIVDQVARCGNSVPPPFAKAIVEANYPFEQ